MNSFDNDSTVQSAETKKELEELQKLASSVFDEITKGFSASIKSGESFDDTLKTILASVGELALEFASAKIEEGFDQFLSQTLSSNNQEQSFASDIISTATNFLGGQFSQAAMPVNVTINAQDANSFKNSEQQIAALMARTVQRGQRNL